MRWVLESSVRFRLVVVVVAVAVLAIGIGQLRSAPVDVLPEFTPPYVEIQTEANGLSADEVEQLITVPLEADLLNGVQGVRVLRSQSLPGLSSVVLVFEPGSDVYRGRQLVQERLTQLGGAAWPMISKPSVVLPPLSSASRVLMIGLSSKDLTPIQQSVIARWTIKPRLMGVPGVANVSIWGMRDQQLQVQVDPEQLRDRDVTLSQVVETAGNAQVFSPLSYLEASTPGTGGFIETGQQRLQVRNVLETIADPDSLGKVPVEDTAGKLRLSEVSDIVVDHQPLIGDAIVNDSNGLLLVVEKYPGADTGEVTSGVEQALAKLRPGLTGLQADTSVFRPADFLEDALDNLTLAMIIASVLLILVLAAFLYQWRAVLICLITIPLSLVVAALVVDALGQTFNAISFAGLAIALALVIDDSVVGAESVASGLRKRGDRTPASAVVEASAAVRGPLTYATLIVLVAVAPVIAMSGRPGDFFGPLAVSYAVAVLAATAVAMIVTPALSSLLFGRETPLRGRSPLRRKLRGRYGNTLLRFAARPRLALIVAAVGVVAAVAALPLLDSSVVPSIKDRHVVVHLDGQPGMSNPRMTEIATAVSRDLRAIPGVENVAAHVGRAVAGDQLVDVNSSEVWVGIQSQADHGATMAAIEDAVAEVPDVRHSVSTYTDQRLRDIGALYDGENRAGGGLDVLTGTSEPLTVRVYGQDPEVLLREADKMQALMSQVDGVVDPQVVRPKTQPTLEIAVDLAKARRYGIKPGDVRRAETTLLQGILVGSVFQQQKVFDVVVQGVPETRADVDAVRNLLIDRPGGGHVRLGQVAEVRVGETASVISRDAVSRRVDVVADVSGRSLDAVAADVEDRLGAASFPLEYHAQVLQTATSDEMGTSRMLAAAVVALIATFLLLQAAFQSWRLAAIGFLALPVALIGGVAGALIDGAELSLGSFAGFLAVFAIAVRSGMLLIRHYQHLEGDEGKPFGPALIAQGARERLMPILTTTGAVAAVAVPVIALGGRPGLEVVSPMAVVVLGGLVTSAFMCLFLLPSFYLHLAASTRRVRPLEDGLRPVLAAPEVADAAANGRRTASNGDADDQDQKGETGAERPLV